MFNLAEELFAPGRKHTDDERRRLALTREDPGDGDPSRGPIDLSSGRVTIRVPSEEDREGATDSGSWHLRTPGTERTGGLSGS
ncbi:hypothetical protein J7E93_01075 [Streptomyces sp. ISL-36]|uniref:DUF6191 domain-containing protein n=1 Tax=Streptomyces sp. ISL-36 TaxID=2819182 RepID=UPI001BEA3D55|nr:DUF6191 domain-containing protein [Streptomyces sp. ISL-36]MBT2438740.1 hypothetical protein [Streptomyces sp. ISL-36]